MLLRAGVSDATTPVSLYTSDVPRGFDLATFSGRDAFVPG